MDLDEAVRHCCELSENAASQLRDHILDVQLISTDGHQDQEQQHHTPTCAKAVVDALSASADSAGALFALVNGPIREIVTRGEGFENNRGAATSLVGLCLLPKSYGGAEIAVPEGTDEADGVSLLLAFVTARLQDYYCTEEGLSVVWAVLARFAGTNTRSPKWLHGWLRDLLRSIFESISVPALPQRQRRVMLSVLLLTLDKLRSVVNELGGEFVLGCLQAIDGEKDPRCLLLSLRLVPALLSVPGHEKFLEDLFEAVACYYPVTFRGSSGGISREVVESLVVSALSASPRFAPFAVPLFIDQLENAPSSGIGKILDTFNQCAERYGAEAMRPCTIEIFNALRFSALADTSSADPEPDHGDDNESVRLVRDCACDCLKRLVHLQASSTRQAHELPASDAQALQARIVVAVDPIVRVCLALLNNADGEDISWIPALVKSLSTVNSTVCTVLAREFVPVVTQMLVSDDSKRARPNKKNLALGVLEGLGGASDQDLVLEPILSPVSDLARAESGFGPATSALASATRALSRSPELSAAVKQAFATLRLCILRQSRTVRSGPAGLTHYLIELLQLPQSDAFKLAVLANILEPMASDFLSGTSDDAADLVELARFDPEFMGALAGSCLQSLGHGGDAGRCLNILASAVASDMTQGAPPPFADDLFSALRRLFDSILERLTASDESVGTAMMMEQLTAGLCARAPESHEGFARQIVSTYGNQLFEVGSNLLQIRVVSAAICAGNVDCDLQLMNRLLELASSRTTRSSVLGCALTTLSPSLTCTGAAFAASLNRCREPSVLSDAVALIRQLIHSENGSDAIADAAYALRALVLSGSAHAAPLATELVRYLASTSTQESGPANARLSAVSFEIVMKRDTSSMFTTQFHGKTSVFGSQRFLCSLLPVLLEMTRQHNEDAGVGVVYCALSLVVCGSTRAALSGELARLLPVFFSAIQKDQVQSIPASQTSVVEGLTYLLALAPQELRARHEAEIPRLVRALSVVCANGEYRGRLSAVRALVLLSRFPYHVLFQVKSIVVNMLGKLLDDTRRDVRNDAARARNAWSMLSS